MTAGAEIHDGCPVFRSGNCVKTLKDGCSSFCSKNLEGRLPISLENLEGRLLIFLLMFFARKTVRKPVFLQKSVFCSCF
jgi:hypothetical protein